MKSVCYKPGLRLSFSANSLCESSKVSPIFPVATSKAGISSFFSSGDIAGAGHQEIVHIPCSS